MRNKVCYRMKCENCGETMDYIARANRVNSSLSDGDIRKMMSMYAEHPQELRYCEHCKLETLQTRVAWIGTLEE